MAKNNLYDATKNWALFWGKSFFILVILLFFVFIGRIVHIQNKYDAQTIKEDIKKNFRVDSLLPARGNLYATDGSILATTVMRYDIYLDFKAMTRKGDTAYTNHSDSLALELGKLFGKPKIHYKTLLDKQFKERNQYFSLVKGLDFDEFDKIRNFPILRKGKSKGGFIVERRYKRELATTEIGAGTIGIDNEHGKTGLEGAFSKYLSGKKGFRTEQKINSKQWKPIDYWSSIDPIDGQDVYTTLDLRIQDIATTALEKQLVEYNAKYGSVVVMEVATGKVRAMVNLTKTEKNGYQDTYNYILKDNIEPGSTFKTISLLAGMDDGFIDENTTIDVGNGTWTYAGQRISDGHGGGTYEISDVLAKSSNVGTAKLIVRDYKDNPKIFFDHLKRWKLFDKMDIELPGISAPRFVTPDNKKWNKATLASISYGYSSNINLLQLASFYNGIANGGTMLKPIFIDKVMKDGKISYEAKPQVMVEKMASEKAIRMMTDALTKAVEKGTAKSIFTPNLKMAGKTGTARLEYWLAGPMKYRASFAGFYPSDNPKYTCYVMVSEPDVSKGYYGGTVAAPVFKEIAGKTFLKTPQNIEKELLVEKKVDLKKLTPSNVKISVKNGVLPNMLGLSGLSVIPQLENLGYRVDYKGVGKIVEQFPTAGTTIKKDQKIYLKLQN